MKILVCISNVPDTTTKITFTNDNTEFNTAGVQYIVNPYDEIALSRAIELTEGGKGTVTAINVGEAANDPTIRKALAIGADDERFIGLLGMGGQNADGGRQIARARIEVTVAGSIDQEVQIVDEDDVVSIENFHDAAIESIFQRQRMPGPRSAQRRMAKLAIRARLFWD